MPVKQAVDTLREVRDGRFLDELSTELNELIRQIRLTDKAGSLSISLKVEPVKGDATMVTVKDQITVKAPKPDTPPTLFYTTVEANITKRDPNQREIPGLRDVSTSESKPVELDEEKPNINEA